MKQKNQENTKHEMKSPYVRFAATIVTSMLIVLGLMYLNSYDSSPIRWDETRLYMIFMMGAVIKVIMLNSTQYVYKRVKHNESSYFGGLVVFVFALFLVRSQGSVDHTRYINAMISHHSIAILTSENAQLENRLLLALVDEVSETRRREIAEMNWLLRDIQENGVAATEVKANARPAPDFEYAAGRKAYRCGLISRRDTQVSEDLRIRIFHFFSRIDSQNRVYMHESIFFANKFR